MEFNSHSPGKPASRLRSEDKHRRYRNNILIIVCYATHRWRCVQASTFYKLKTSSCQQLRTNVEINIKQVISARNNCRLLQTLKSKNARILKINSQNTKEMITNKSCQELMYLITTIAVSDLGAQLEHMLRLIYTNIKSQLIIIQNELSFTQEQVFIQK